MLLGILLMCVASMLWGYHLGAGMWRRRDEDARLFRLASVGGLLLGGVLISVWWWLT